MTIGKLIRLALALLVIGVKYHAPRSAGKGDARGVFKAAASWLRWYNKHGQNAPASHGLPHRGGFPTTPIGIKRNKQREHMPGTPEYNNRAAQNKAQGKAPPSAWSVPPSRANDLTWRAWHQGDPVPRSPNKRQLRTDDVVGHTGDGRPQRGVRAHIDENGEIHGHPANYKKR